VFTAGTVTRWLKKEGERVAADEPLVEVSTDKVDTEIPSPATGVLREITVAEDETAEAGAQIAVIVEEDGASGGGAPPAEDSPAGAVSFGTATPSPQPDQPVPAGQSAPPEQQPTALALSPGR
jgi:pyruvate dehydrogenase E2 component (dihydrolipoamide acetyltransferase)